MELTNDWCIAVWCHKTSHYWPEISLCFLRVLCDWQILVSRWNCIKLIQRRHRCPLTLFAALSLTVWKNTIWKRLRRTNPWNGVNSEPFIGYFSSWGLWLLFQHWTATNCNLLPLMRVFPGFDAVHSPLNSIIVQTHASSHAILHMV